MEPEKKTTEKQTPDLVAAMAAMGRSIADQIGERLATVTQTNEAAFKAFVDAQREERAAAAERGQRDIEEHIKARVAEQMTKLQAEHLAAARAERKTEYELTDAVDEMSESIGLLKRESKILFRNIGSMRAKSTPDYVLRYGGDAKPFDVLMRGAFVAHGSDRVKVFHVDDPLLAEFREICDQLFMWRQIRRYQSNGIAPSDETFPRWNRFRHLREMVSRALDTTDTANWVPTSFSSELILRFDMERDLVGRFPVANVPRFPFDFPVLGSRTTSFKITQNTADPENATRVSTSDLEDLKVSFTRSTLGARTSWSYELDEDSIIAMATTARDELGRSMAFSEEQAVLDSDNSTFHFDNDVSNSTTDVRRLAFKGLRKLAVANSYVRDGSAFTIETFKNEIRSLGKFGAKRTDILFCGPAVLGADLLTIKDSANNAVMVGVPGGGGVPLAQTQGDVMRILNVPWISCEAFRTDLNATGFYDGTTTTKTGFLCVKTSAFRYAMTSAAPQVESDRDIETRQMILVASMSRDFQPVYAIASNHIVDMAYNITS